MSQKRLFHWRTSARCHLCCAFWRCFEECCQRFWNSAVDAKMEAKMPFSKKNWRPDNLHQRRGGNNGYAGQGIWNHESGRRVSDSCWEVTCVWCHCCFSIVGFLQTSAVLVFVFPDDWLNLFVPPVIFLQNLMIFGWQFRGNWERVQFKHAIHSGCQI